MRKNKLLYVLLSLCLCLAFTPITASARGDPDEELPDKVNTSWAEEEPTPLTPEGNLTLVDDTSKTVERDFLTVATRNGHYFYLIVDRAKNGENNVHFLNQVDESDLLAIIEDGDEDKPPVVCTCNDRCYPGHVDTSCPVCAVNMGECTGKEPEPVKPEPSEEQAPEAKPEPEPVRRGGANPAVAVVLALLVAGGGAAYYLKFRTPKQDAKGPVDLEDYDYGFEDEPEDGEESPDGESEEAGDEET